jgi:alpha,alpha-trehalose phosphorylase
MVIPYDDLLGVHPQAEGFTAHQVWDFASTTPDQYPLFEHFPYFDLYRKQVVKQADLVLAMHLRGEAFTPQQKAANFSYYESLTVRDSSLSACTQAVIAAEVGHLELAYDYVAEAALMDLEDREHNTRDGLHVAALAGTWIALVEGLAGMRQAGDTLSFAPHLPTQITRLGFGVMFRGRHLRVTATHEATGFQLLSGDDLEIVHFGQTVSVWGTDSALCQNNREGRLTSLPAPTQPVGGSHCAAAWRNACRTTTQLRDPEILQLVRSARTCREFSGIPELSGSVGTCGLFLVPSAKRYAGLTDALTWPERLVPGS